MSEEELKAIEDRAEHSTGRPWFSKEAKAGSEPLEIWEVILPFGMLVAGEMTKRDAEFIAHARSDIPALVSEVRRLRKLVDGG